MRVSCASSFKGALIVNPFDREQFATTIATALMMGEADKVTRHAQLLNYVNQNTASIWAERFMDALKEAGNLSREFNALAHLADMLDDYGDKKGALATYRKVQALDPQNDAAKRAVRKLSREVEGEKI